MHDFHMEISWNLIQRSVFDSHMEKYWNENPSGEIMPKKFI